jgi:predicted nucleic acid-binding protein
MTVLDTDIRTLLLQGQPKVVERRRQETDLVVISIVSRIEVFQGRFATLLKAADGEALKRGQQRLDQAEIDLQPFPVLRIADDVATRFDRLRQAKKTSKMRRNDMLIAAIVQAYSATLVTTKCEGFPDRAWPANRELG